MEDLVDSEVTKRTAEGHRVKAVKGSVGGAVSGLLMLLVSLDQQDLHPWL